MCCILLHLQSLSNRSISFHGRLTCTNLGLDVFRMKLVNPIVLQHPQGTLAGLFKNIALSTLQKHQPRHIIFVSVRQSLQQLLRISSPSLCFPFEHTRQSHIPRRNIPHSTLVPPQPGFNNLLRVLNTRNQRSQSPSPQYWPSHFPVHLEPSKSPPQSTSYAVPTTFGTCSRLSVPWVYL